MLWGFAEVACTIIAASIPTLRVLFVDENGPRSMPSLRIHFTDKSGTRSRATRQAALSQAVSRTAAAADPQKLDDKSDRSIIGTPVGPRTTNDLAALEEGAGSSDGGKIVSYETVTQEK